MMHLLEAAAAATHVFVDNMPSGSPERGFGLNEPTWVAISAIVTAIAAAATAAMAILTRALAIKTGKVADETADLAKETKDLAASSVNEMQQAERHHLDTLAPLVFLSIKATSTREGTTVRIDYVGTISNAGPGPATNVEVLIKPGTFVARRYTIGMLAASTTTDFKRTISYDAVSAPPTNVPFTLFVLYKDIFGRCGGTFQTSHSGFAEHCVVEQLIRPGVQSEDGLSEIVRGRDFTGHEPIA